VTAASLGTAGRLFARRCLAGSAGLILGIGVGALALGLLSLELALPLLLFLAFLVQLSLPFLEVVVIAGQGMLQSIEGRSAASDAVRG
jgi:hypothetical protein